MAKSNSKLSGPARLSLPGEHLDFIEANSVAAKAASAKPSVVAKAV